MSENGRQAVAIADPALRAALRYAEKQGFAGPDPYDALSSSLLRGLPSSWARRLVTQAVKRSPVGVRSILGVRPLRMSKTLALLIPAYARIDASETADALLRELLRRTGPTGLWGYEFDVQVRWAHYAVGVPNIVVSAFAVEAMHHLSAKGMYAAQMRSEFIRTFFRDDWFFYVPGTGERIVNAHALGIRAAIRLGMPSEQLAPSVAALAACQDADGSWPYGLSNSTQWRDNFHTAYVLMSMDDVAHVLPDVESLLARGVQYWLSELFDNQGVPRYFQGRTNSPDVHNVATALRALVQLQHRYPECSQFVLPTLRALLRHQDGEGAFRARPGAPAFMRWNQAHAIEALSALVATCHADPPQGED